LSWLKDGCLNLEGNATLKPIQNTTHFFTVCSAYLPRKEAYLLITNVPIYHCKRISILVLTVLFCLLLPLTSCAHTDSADKELASIIPEMFFHPLPLRDDVIINAGELGRYSFSEDTTHIYDAARHIQIRPELVDLLNELQAIFKHPMIITSGYRSQQHQIYLWAKWLGDRPEKARALNEENYPTWANWINASQDLPGCPSLRSKHQTGDAVNFYCTTLDFNSEKQRKLLTGLIREAGGTGDYTPEERIQFGIPDDDNYLLEVVGHPSNKDIKGDKASPQAYFHVVYRPSEAPAMPSIERIGRLLTPDQEEKYLYTRGEILLIETDGYGYFAEVIEDTQLNDSEVSVRFFVKEIAKKLGDKISINTVVTKREKPENGWGTQKVLLQYFDGKTWISSEDVTVFEDHYLLPESISGERKVPFNKVRIPSFRPKKEIQ